MPRVDPWKRVQLCGRLGIPDSRDLDLRSLLSAMLESEEKWTAADEFARGVLRAKLLSHQMCLIVFLTISVCIVIVHPVPVCKVNEFTCRNGKCIRMDRYCDGINDCGDKSDEPSTCSPCNRTYYGDTSKTYDLEIPRPRSDRIPFLCHLTFSANGNNYGDFVQLLFDSFHIGRYESSAFDQCPDGYLQIMELGRPFTGGAWCGSASGRAMYFSETNTITATIKLLYTPQSTNFQLKLRYRFINDFQAVARYGNEAQPIHQGEAVPGSYCNRNLYDCSKKNCRLQSPNYPGLYPRNVTCAFNIKQKDYPTCKHAMISIKQDNSYRMQIKRSIAVASMNKTRDLRTWNECSGNKDYLIFYDGPTTQDPVLLMFCGGDWLPEIVSRGPEMLVTFHSSPYSEPSHPATTTSPFTGFELDIDILYSDSASLDYARNSRGCEFNVNATGPDGDEALLRSPGRAGYVISPRHTLPPNTTCIWHFRGRPTDLVWLYFMSYFHETLIPVNKQHETGPTANKQPKGPGTDIRNPANFTSKCSTRLRIWDGGGKDGRYTLLGDYCEMDVPKLCDHGSLSNTSRATRPCTNQESYLSTGTDLLIQLYSQLGTALNPVKFRLWYGFVDTRLGGEYWHSRRPEDIGKSPCVRIFRKKRRGLIHSPRNIFLYGKGGATNLSCVYRIEGSPSDRVKLTLLNASFGDNACTTESDPHSQRPNCARESTSNRIVELRIYESPWREVALPHSCFCDNSTVSPDRPYVLHSSSRSLEIHFRISRFNITEDHLSLYFHAKFELIKSVECERQQKIVGSGGEIEFSYPPSSSSDASCYGIPWLVEAHHNTSLFLLTWGAFMPREPSAEDLVKCPTRNRILIYSGRPSRLLRIVCPLTPNSRPFSVHIFSEEWFSGSSAATSIPSPTGQGPTLHLEPPRPPSFLVEFVGFEPGIAQLNWLEISRTRSSFLRQFQYEHLIPRNASNNESYELLPSWDCQHKCPELNACISEVLWCDGRANCPSGFDESETHCGVGHRFITLIPGGMYAILVGSAASLTVFSLLLALLITFKIRKTHKDDLYNIGYRNGQPKRVPTDELLLDPDSTRSS